MASSQEDPDGQHPGRLALQADIRRAIKAIKATEVTVLCPPEIEPSLRTAVEEAGLDHVTVLGSPHLPTGQCYIMPTHPPFPRT